ncbi:DinB family protein [Flagellimonas sp.]|uniref:DinB family protein n=1 Tax=Flagellimonas sp. TaxID=2058762 RepID=UPI003B51BFF0
MNAQQISMEMEQEIISTTQLLKLVPEDRLHYQPHAKAMTLGQLALHVATIPYFNLGYAKDGQVEAAVIVNHPQPLTKDDILEGLEKSKKAVQSVAENETDQWLNANWKLTDNGNTLAEMPTVAFIRTFVLNHWYHHRGQLSTYLRSLELALPSIYGPSADVNPFS